MATSCTCCSWSKAARTVGAWTTASRDGASRCRSAPIHPPRYERALCVPPRFLHRACKPAQTHRHGQHGRAAFGATKEDEKSSPQSRSFASSIDRHGRTIQAPPRGVACVPFVPFVPFVPLRVTASLLSCVACARSTTRRAQQVASLAVAGTSQGRCRQASPRPARPLDTQLAPPAAPLPREPTRHAPRPSPRAPKRSSPCE
jgi:hypothetical protein